MRIAVGLIASATLLFVTGTLGIVGAWALVTGVVLAVASAVSAVVAMEERERVDDGTPVEAAYLARIDNVT